MTLLTVLPRPRTNNLNGRGATLMLKLAVQKVGRHGCNLTIAFVLRQTPALWSRSQGLQAQQSFNPVRAAFDALCQQVTPDTPGAIGSIAGKEARLHLLDYSLITPGSGLGGRLSQEWKPDRDTPIA